MTAHPVIVACAILMGASVFLLVLAQQVMG